MTRDDDAGPVPEQFPKRCTCCGIKLTPFEWKCLTKRGYVGEYMCGRELRAVELRDCWCESTLGVEVTIDLKGEAP